MFTVQRLTLEEAVTMVKAAEEEATRIGVKQVICISDDGGGTRSP